MSKRYLCLWFLFFSLSLPLSLPANQSISNECKKNAVPFFQSKDPFSRKNKVKIVPWWETDTNGKTAIEKISTSSKLDTTCKSQLLKKGIAEYKKWQKNIRANKHALIRMTSDQKLSQVVPGNADYEISKLDQLLQNNGWVIRRYQNRLSELADQDSSIDSSSPEAADQRSIPNRPILCDANVSSFDDVLSQLDESNELTEEFLDDFNLPEHIDPYRDAIEIAFNQIDNERDDIVKEHQESYDDLMKDIDQKETLMSDGVNALVSAIDEIDKAGNVDDAQEILNRASEHLDKKISDWKERQPLAYLLEVANRRLAHKVDARDAKRRLESSKEDVLQARKRYGHDGNDPRVEDAHKDYRAAKKNLDEINNTIPRNETVKNLRHSALSHVTAQHGTYRKEFTNRFNRRIEQNNISANKKKRRLLREYHDESKE